MCEDVGLSKMLIRDDGEGEMGRRGEEEDRFLSSTPPEWNGFLSRAVMLIRIAVSRPGN